MFNHLENNDIIFSQFGALPNNIVCLKTRDVDKSDESYTKEYDYRISGKAAMSIIEQIKDEGEQKVRHNIGDALSNRSSGPGSRYTTSYVKVMKVKSKAEVLIRISITVAYDV